MLKWLFGEIHFKFQGREVERFLNLAFSRQVDLREVKYTTDGLTFKTTLKNFRQVKAIGKRVGGKTKVIAKEGVWFWWKKALKRPGIIAGLFLLLGIIYFLTGFIWFIEIDGFSGRQREILDILKTRKVKPFVRKKAVDEKMLKREILAQIPDMAWVGIEKKGVRLIITGKMREESYRQKYKKADIVAKREGIIKEILVFRGSLRVKPGQKVTAGEVLISGVDERGEPIVAEGTVKAVTWYKKKVRMPLREERLVPTGQENSLVKLYLGKKEITLKKPPKNFALAIMVEKRYKFSLGKRITIPVELYKVTSKEVERKVRNLTLEEGEQKAYNLALEELKKEVDMKQITNMDKTVRSLGDAVEVVVKAQAIEDIGQISGIQED
ncbi:sporulation protein YqfD [Carboxydothermus islandicus]|uniref:Sporulation protein YqfD n=1 Tax=Carboxydothermus islandicus TaxID=661089 RepID=A0A1L8D320_9THEO|nr:sporulation protein YqfD [Carboxydothermus islandicus]GAV25481.1 sporulation protein YqfD [Carboxydothermus islandicus]